MPAISANRQVLVFGLFSFATACSGGNGDRGWQSVTNTIGDTIIVHTTAGSVWDSPRRLEPDPVHQP